MPIYVYSEGKVMVHPLWIFSRWRQWKVFLDQQCISHGVLQLLRICRKRIVYGFYLWKLSGFRNWLVLRSLLLESFCYLVSYTLICYLLMYALARLSNSGFLFILVYSWTLLTNFWARLSMSMLQSKLLAQPRIWDNKERGKSLVSFGALQLSFQ